MRTLRFLSQEKSESRLQEFLRLGAGPVSFGAAAAFCRELPCPNGGESLELRLSSSFTGGMLLSSSGVGSLVLRCSELMFGGAALGSSVLTQTEQTDSQPHF